MFEGISLCFDSCDMYLLNMQSRNFILHAVPEAMSCFVGGIDQRIEIKKKHGFCKENTLSKLYNLIWDTFWLCLMVDIQVSQVMSFKLFTFLA